MAMKTTAPKQNEQVAKPAKAKKPEQSAKAVRQELGAMASEFGTFFNEGPVDAKLASRLRGEEDPASELDLEDEEEDTVEPPLSKKEDRKHATESKLQRPQQRKQVEVEIDEEEPEETVVDEEGQQEEVLDEEEEGGDPNSSFAAELAEMRQQLVEAQATIALLNQGQLPPQTQQAQQPQTQAQQRQEITMLKPGARIELPEVSEDQLAELTSDPRKFKKYMEESLSLIVQQSRVDLMPMVQQTIGFYRVTDEFFERPANKDISKGVLRQLVNQRAAQLEEQGMYTGIIPTLEKAAEMVRTELKLRSNTGKKQDIGRTGLVTAQEAEQIRQIKPAGNRFPTGASGRRVAKKGGNEKHRELRGALADMLEAGGIEA